MSTLPSGGYQVEQLEYNSSGSLGSSVTRFCQKLTIDGIIRTLAFFLTDTGSPTGDITFTIRRVSDDGVIASKVWGDASDIPDTNIWMDVTFDDPVAINEEVRLCFENSGSSSGNSVGTRFSNVNILSNQVLEYYDGTWNQLGANYDMTYGYDSQIVKPTVSTQACTAFGLTSVTGNGRLEDLGTTDVTAHGHCWETKATVDARGTPPVVEDNNVDNGAGSVGVFTSAVTGMTEGTQYILRAYATNSGGTSYGNAVTFTSGISTTQMLDGNLAVKGTGLHYIDWDGNERVLKGALVV